MLNFKRSCNLFYKIGFSLIILDVHAPRSAIEETESDDEDEDDDEEPEMFEMDDCEKSK